ncbi:hypothetical protein HHI36_014834 [Cryptolaemus montrouzieri]|uniref:Uncharacterized protein n=1 Tax=Cryptolaemus montrouzieri TaxID=559131 RepID=A0ABD2N4N0_9CUCU
MKTGNINPVSIGKIFYFDFNNRYKILNIARHGLKRVEVHETAANDFVECNPFNSGTYKAFIPAIMVTTMGIARDIGLGITEEDVVKLGNGLYPDIKVLRNCLKKWGKR